MTYEIRINDDDTWSLLDGSGAVVEADNQLPVSTPDDIIDSILDDIGVGSPQREALKALFKRDWTINDTRW